MKKDTRVGFQQRAALSAGRACLFEKGRLNIVLFPYTCGLGSAGQTLFLSLSAESGSLDPIQGL